MFKGLYNGFESHHRHQVGSYILALFIGLKCSFLPFMTENAIVIPQNKDEYASAVLLRSLVKTTLLDVLR